MGGVSMAGWSLLIAVAGVVIAGAGAAIAVWQARLAKSAGEAAEKMARAAAEQAELLRRQVEAGEAPSFAFDISPLDRAETGSCRIAADGSREFVSETRPAHPDVSAWVRSVPVRMAMTAGPGEVSVTVTLPDAPAGEIWLLDAGPHLMVPESAVTIRVIRPYNWADSEVGLIIASRETGGRGREWTRRQAVSVTARRR
jgi:hypothetical protein